MLLSAPFLFFKNKVIMMKPRKVPRKKVTTPTKRFRINKKATVTSILAATLMFSAHVVVKKQYGRAYSKRIPLVGKVIRNKNQFDFYFSPHVSAKDLAGLNPILKKAKLGGKPYNTMLMEAANMTHKERSKKEAIYKRSKSFYKDLLKMKDQLSAMRGSKGLAKGWVDKRITQVNRIIKNSLEDPELGFDNQKVLLAVQHGLEIKFAESYTPREIEQMQKLNRNANASDQTYQTLKPQYLAQRDKRISQTLVNLEKHSTKPIRAIVILGTMHLGAQTRTERQSFARTSIAAEYYTPELQVELKAIMKEVRSLQKRSMRIK